jgi:molecular chaperone GrpE
MKIKNTLVGKGLEVVDVKAGDVIQIFAEAITQIPAPSDKMKGKLLMYLKRI